MKKFTALLLVFSLLVLSGNLHARKKGAELIILKNDAHQIRGELIAVKKTSLLLKESLKGADVTVDIEEVLMITIVKKPKIGLVSIGGFIIGGVLGAYVGSNMYDLGEVELILMFGLVGGVAFGSLGALISGGFASDEKIKLPGMSDTEINEVLEKLRSRARVRNFQ